LQVNSTEERGVSSLRGGGKETHLGVAANTGGNEVIETKKRRISYHPPSSVPKRKGREEKPQRHHLFDRLGGSRDVEKGEKGITCSSLHKGWGKKEGIIVRLPPLLGSAIGKRSVKKKGRRKRGRTFFLNLLV